LKATGEPEYKEFKKVNKWLVSHVGKVCSEMRMRNLAAGTVTLLREEFLPSAVNMIIPIEKDECFEAHPGNFADAVLKDREDLLELNKDLLKKLQVCMHCLLMKIVCLLNNLSPCCSSSGWK
jgi:hypothetical protein